MPDAELSQPELERWGEQLGASLRAPALITLTGDLGAGKTTLVQAICRGYGVSEPVTSPTFALVHQYRAPKSPVWHLDLYRINSPRELANIGWEDALAAQAIVCVEWADRAGPELPSATHAISLAHSEGAPDRRRISW